MLVRDNGSGIPEQVERGLGLELAETLVAEDLRGGIRFHRLTPSGTEVSIRIPRSSE